MRISSILMVGLVALATGAVPRDQPQVVDKDLKNIGEATRVANILEQILDYYVSLARDYIIENEPWLKRYLHLSDYLYPGSHFTLENVAAAGLGSFWIPFRVVQVPPNFPLRLLLDIKVVVPVLDIEVENYDLDWVGLCIPIYGNGASRLRITNLSVTVRATITPVLSSNCISLEVAYLHATVSVDTFELHVTGLWQNEKHSSLASSIVSTFTPEVLEIYEQEISALLSPWLKLELNKLLSGKNFGSLSDIISYDVHQQAAIDQLVAIAQQAAIDQ